ncbi:MAG: peptidylprolyl isomerase [Pyrinomonadaceae bacterium]|nr:peptidylprolyl isomerase [Pyrinomonadaceae bacterium]
MSKRALIVILMIVTMGAGLLIWRKLDTRTRAARVESKILRGLTAEELNLVFKSQAVSDVGAVAAITERPETRQAFLKGIREHLALAAEARREGLSEDPNFKINLDYKENLLLADLYSAKLSKDPGKYVVPRSDIDAVWTNPENENQFNKDQNALRTIQAAVARERGDQQSYGNLQGESLVKAREKWARTRVLSNRAKNDVEFMSRPEIGLRFRVLEAGILSADYLRKHWAKSIRATEQDIAAYLAAHPEYDLNRKREKAEKILKRARAGEDFARLASEFSEDRSTKDTGGLYEDVEKDTFWVEVGDAALALEPGQVAETLIETQVGYHIVKLENKRVKKKEDGSQIVTFSFRHILLQKSFEEPVSRYPEIPPPFMKAEEIAKGEIEKAKRNKFVEQIVQRNQIDLPEDFRVDLPEIVTTRPLPNPGSASNAASQQHR